MLRHLTKLLPNFQLRKSLRSILYEQIEWRTVQPYQSVKLVGSRESILRFPPLCAQVPDRNSEDGQRRKKEKQKEEEEMGQMAVAKVRNFIR